MAKILSLGLTGKKLLAQGFLFVLLGLILMVTGTWLPVKVIRLVLFLAWIATVLDLVLRIFKKSQSTDTLGVALVKLLVLGYLLGSNLATDVPIYILALVIGVYQIFHASINLVTYVLYRKNKIRPRFRLLLDGLVLVFLGGTSLLSSTGNSVFQLFVLGAYFFLYGVSNIRDGFLFEEEIGKNHLKRRVRISLPIVLAALIPASTLAKINKFMQENADEREDIHLGMVKSGKTAELEIFIHTAETSLFSAIGHVDICYQGRVISYGNYDPSSETLFGMVGDGVLYFCDRDKYIDLCKRESQKTLFGYGIDLTPEMEKAVQKKLAELKQLTIPWEPSADKIMTGDGKEDYIYAYKIRHETDGELYKFIKSKFKSYFVLSTNCVLLADTIVGQAGTDILSPKGFIAPGTYQAYLDREFEKPNSIVVSKHVY
ncbi:membrane protein [Streptococcus sp. SR1]|uniref:membrane protein n=1 Tax=Streptococcus sp. SR1 TaxID=1161416 RepID=UPI0004483E7D|nr:membrane protein [Streptococcus sp. SR1]EUC80010.1 putative membrane protein [Streptococcus sp. SR1]